MGKEKAIENENLPPRKTHTHIRDKEKNEKKKKKKEGKKKYLPVFESCVHFLLGNEHTAFKDKTRQSNGLFTRTQIITDRPSKHEKEVDK